MHILIFLIVVWRSETHIFNAKYAKILNTVTADHIDFQGCSPISPLFLFNLSNVFPSLYAFSYYLSAHLITCLL